MKKITTALLLIISINCFGQTKDTTATQATPLLSANDLGRIDSIIQRKFTIAQQAEYMEIARFMGDLLNQKAQAYNAKQKSEAIKPKTK